jgi:hypothetical protein
LNKSITTLFFMLLSDSTRQWGCTSIYYIHWTFVVKRINQLITDKWDKGSREEENTLEFACIRKIVYKLLERFVVLPISLW